MPRLTSFSQSGFSGFTSPSGYSFDPTTADIQTGITAPSGTYLLIDEENDRAFTTGSSSFTIWDMSAWPNASATQIGTGTFSPTWEYAGGDKPVPLAYDNINELVYVGTATVSGRQGRIHCFDISDPANPNQIQTYTDANLGAWPDFYGLAFTVSNGNTHLISAAARGIESWPTSATGIRFTSGSQGSYTQATFSGSLSVVKSQEGQGPSFWASVRSQSNTSFMYPGTASTLDGNSYAMGTFGAFSANGVVRYVNHPYDPGTDTQIPTQAMYMGRAGYYCADSDLANTTFYDFDNYTHRGDYTSSTNAGDRDLAVYRYGVLAATDYFAGRIIFAVSNSGLPYDNNWTYINRITNAAWNNLWPNESWLKFYKGALMYNGATIR